jgi:hypothetical protein
MPETKIRKAQKKPGGGACPPPLPSFSFGETNQALGTSSRACFIVMSTNRGVSRAFWSSGNIFYFLLERWGGERRGGTAF